MTTVTFGRLTVSVSVARLADPSDWLTVAAA